MPVYTRDEYEPKAHLSAAGIHEHFLIPCDPLGNHVAESFDVVWIHYNGETQPAIYSKDLHYPGHRPATKEEIKAYQERNS